MNIYKTFSIQSTNEPHQCILTVASNFASVGNSALKLCLACSLINKAQLKNTRPGNFSASRSHLTLYVILTINSRCSCAFKIM